MLVLGPFSNTRVFLGLLTICYLASRVLKLFYFCYLIFVVSHQGREKDLRYFSCCLITGKLRH